MRERASTKKVLAGFIDSNDPHISQVVALIRPKHSEADLVRLGSARSASSQTNGDISEKSGSAGGSGSKGTSFGSYKVRHVGTSELISFLSAFEKRENQALTEQNGFTTPEIAMVKNALQQAKEGILIRAKTGYVESSLSEVQQALFLRKVKGAFELTGEHAEKQKIAGELLGVLAFGIRVFDKADYSSLQASNQLPAPKPPEQS